MCASTLYPYYCSEHGGVDLNFVHTTVISSGIAALRCCCASDVVETLTTSDRVCTDDIPLALSFPMAWSQHVVLRQWRTIPPHHEFRVFIYQGKITGPTLLHRSAFLFDVTLRRRSEPIFLQMLLSRAARPRNPCLPPHQRAVCEHQRPAARSACGVRAGCRC